MSSNNVAFKCYYGNEIRRISLAAGSLTYPHLVEQLQQAFSIPPTLQLRLRWLDDEGDKVSLTTSDELADAVRCLADKPDRQPGQAVRVFVTSVEPAEPAEVHEGVTCDGCGCGVAGHRFKCMLCPNYDLCSACVAADTHSQHPMILIRRSGHFPENPFADFSPRWGFGGFFGPPGRTGGYGPRGGGCGSRGGGCGPRGGGCGPRDGGCGPRSGGCGTQGGGCGPRGGGCGPRGGGCFSPQKFRDLFAGAAGDVDSANNADNLKNEENANNANNANNADSAEAMATDSSSRRHDNGTPDPRVARALEHMQAMGFSDDGGWLTRLLVAKDGDISAVLDALRPSKGSTVDA